MATEFTDMTNRHFKDVPAEICESCDEIYLSDEVTGPLFEVVENAIASTADVEIRRYAD